jgi:hypothetical protein
MNIFTTFFNWITIFLIVITAYCKFLHSPTPTAIPLRLKEKYNANLSWINSIETLKLEVSNRLNYNFQDTSLLVNTIDDILRERFYHGYSEYTLRQNWIAYLLGKKVMWGFICPVIEDDILKFPMGACSQQSLVFQKMLKDYGITYGTTNFTSNKISTGGHFGVSAYYSDNWHLFDSNQEPIKLPNNPSYDKLVRDSLLVKSYPNLTTFMEGKVKYNLINRSDVNYQRGRKMYFFQLVTGFLSSWLWLISLISLLIFKFKLMSI